jgi:hypothetical protein
MNTPKSIMRIAKEVSPEAASLLMLMDKLEEAMGITPNKAKPNKANHPTSFSDWLEQNGDSIGDIGGNWTPDRQQANHDIYKNGNPFQ